MCLKVRGYKTGDAQPPQASEILPRVFPLTPNSRSMKFTPNIVALPFLPLLLATVAHCTRAWR